MWCRFPDDVRPRGFRHFLKKIAQVQGPFDAKKAALECNVTLGTSRKYIKILCDNGLVKVVSKCPPTYIASYTPLNVIPEGLEEEALLGLRRLLEPWLNIATEAIKAYLDLESSY